MFAALAEFPSETQVYLSVDSVFFLFLASEPEFFTVELVDPFHLPLAEAAFLCQVSVLWP